MLLALLAVGAAGVLVVAIAEEPGERDEGRGTEVRADVLDYEPPTGSRDPTGAVTVAYPVGSSEVRSVIETRREEFGPTVGVVYDPDRPSRARVAGEGRGDGVSFDPWPAVVASGVALALAALLFAVVGRRSSR